MESGRVFETPPPPALTVVIVSIPNEQERNRNVPIRNAFEEIFCLRSNISDHDIISA